jgi:uncharacterized membrane protein
MSEIKNIKTGNFTVVSNGAAAITIALGFVPYSVELTNQTTGDSALFIVDVTAGVTSVAAGAAGGAVNYDSANGGSEGGTIATVTKAGFAITAALVGYNDTTAEVLRYVART